MIPVVYLGSDSYAADLLSYIHTCGLFEVRRVITQPAKPIGRKQTLTPTPVAVYAAQHGLPYHTPERLQGEEALVSDVSLALTTRYGNIVPEPFLQTPAYGVINVHPSLLPAYRGASPIQSALLHGDTQTGVTLMKMDKGLDTGPILIQKPLAIEPTDTYITISERTTQIATQLIEQAVPDYVAGKLVPIDQGSSGVTRCTKIEKNDGQIDWTLSAAEIYNRFRAYIVWPGVWSLAKGRRIKLLHMLPPEPDTFAAPGELRHAGDRLFVGTAHGSVRITKLQVEGSVPVTSTQFMTGAGREISRFDTDV